MKKPSKERCEHNWSYEHTIYSLDARGDGLAIHRQCQKCDVHELCKVRHPSWTRNTKGFHLTDLCGDAPAR